MDNAAISKIFAHVASTGDHPSATIADFSKTDMKKADIRIYDKHEFDRKGDFMTDIDDFHVKVAAKGIKQESLQDKTAIIFSSALRT